MNGKERSRILRKIFALVIIFSLLQGHLSIICDSFNAAYAAINSSLEEIVEEQEDEITTSDISSSIEIGPEFESESNKNPDGFVGKDVIENQIDDSEKIPENVLENIVEDEKVENVITNDNIENKEEEKVETDAEQLVADAEILKCFRYKDGFILKTKISSEIINLKADVDTAVVKITKPVIENYILKGSFVDGITSEDKKINFTYNTEGEKIVIDAIAEENTKKYKNEYFLTFVFEGSEDVTEVVIEFNETLTYVTPEDVENDKNVNPENQVGDGAFLGNVELDATNAVTFNPVVGFGFSKPLSLDVQTLSVNEYKIGSQNSSIYKGYLYANAVSDLSYETKYTSVDIVKINYLDNINNIFVSESVDIIKTKEGENVSLQNLIDYKSTKVNKEIFDKMFGTSGYIEIYSNEKYLGRIDSTLEVEDDSYVFYYDSMISNVEFKLFGIRETGTLNILNNKAIKKTSVFNKNQIANFDKIETNINVKENTKIEENNYILTEYNSKLEINLEETESRIDLNVDTNVLSTSVQNEVVFSMIVRTDEEKYELFKNPEMTIELPSDVVDAKITNINLLYKNGLSIDTYDVIENEFGNKVIKVRLVGNQSEYMPGLIAKGTTVNIYTTLTLDRLTTNTEANLKFKYTNEISDRLAYINDGKDAEEFKFEYITKAGLLKALYVTNSVTGEHIELYDNDIKDMLLNSEVVEQNITYKGIVVNNFNESINKVEIIGKLPILGNKDANGNDLGSTFDTTLIAPITVNGIASNVYYSELINPESDSNWTQDITDISKYKSFKIVIQNEEMKKGDKIEFSYQIKTPDNLGYNQKAFATYGVSYEIDNQKIVSLCTNKIYTEEKELTMDDITDNEKEELPILTIGTKVTQAHKTLTENDEVFERQILKYSIVVTNNTNEVARNVRIKASADNGKLYYYNIYQDNDYADDVMRSYKIMAEDDGTKGYEEFIIDVLEPGDTQSFSYQIVVNELSEGVPSEIKGIIKVNSDNMEEMEVTTISNKIKDTDLSLKLEWAYRERVDYIEKYSEGNLKYRIITKNISDKVLENQEVTLVFPKFIHFNLGTKISGAEDADIKIEESGDNYLLTMVIPKYEVGEEKILYIPVSTSAFPIDVLSKAAELYSYTNVDGNMVYSNIYVDTIYQRKTGINYTWNSDKPETYVLQDKDTLVYSLTVTNTGKVNSKYVEIHDELPKGLVVENVYAKKNGEEEKDEKWLNINKNDVTYTTDLDVGDVLSLEIHTKVNELYYDFDQKVVENKAFIDGGSYFEKVSTDVISHNIKNSRVIIEQEDEIKKPETNKNEQTTNKNDENKTQTQTNNKVPSTNKETVKNYYSLEGKAWLDLNKNGLRDTSEKGMKAIGVYLYKVNADGKVNDSNLVSEIATNENGDYVFNKLEEGKYIVGFGYDISLYTTTKYQVKSAKENENSDVVNKKVIAGKNEQKIAMTDIIDLTQGGVKNIDCGLVSLNDFDMSLIKYISSVKVKNKKGVQEYRYDEGDKLAKVEIHSKLFESSELTIEYKIKVTNDGNIDGYVNKIIDYKAEDLEFNPSLNKDWSMAKDGTLTYLGLIDRTIKPGESKEVSLVLTKKIDSVRTNQIINTAEIVEATNEKGFVDVDSTLGNKIEYEDDFGKVVLLVTVSTGKVVNGMLIGIAVIAMIGVAICVRLLCKKKFYV